MFKFLSSDTLSSLSTSEIDVLKYIDNNKRKILNMSIQEVSKETFISTATIVRLCKKIGLGGFTELKYKLRENIKDKENKIEDDKSISEIINQNLYELKQTCNLIDKENVEKAVKLLLSDKNIHFFGKGLTDTAFKYTSKHLLTCNRLNICYEDTHIAYLAAEKMSEKDVVFLSSLSGKTKQIIKMAQIAKSKGATIVAITNIDNNIIANLADINFYVYVDDSENNEYEYDMKSRLPILLILNTIVKYYVECKK